MSSEQGSATVLATMLAGAVVVLALTVAWWAGAVSVRHRAAAAADLAAVAGAQAWVRGEPACAAARRYADANGALLVRCEVRAASLAAQVEVSRQVPVLGRTVTVSARQTAWAGPATPR